MKRKIPVFIFATLLLFGCEKNNVEIENQWSYNEKLSVKDVSYGKAFNACSIDGNEILLLSLDKFIRVDNSEKIIEERTIDTKNFMPNYKGGFLSKDFYVLANYLKLSTDSKVDSLQFDFYSTKKDNLIPKSINTNIFPNSDIYEYQIKPFFEYEHEYKYFAVNSSGQIGIIVTSYRRNQPNDQGGIHHLAIIDLNINQEGINPKFNRLINIDDLAWNKEIYNIKAIGKNFFISTSRNGTYFVKPTGEITNFGNNKAVFGNDHIIYQFGGKQIEQSVDCSEWKWSMNIDFDYVFEVDTIDNKIIDYSSATNMTSYSLSDFSEKRLVSKGLPEGRNYFIKEFNSKIYIGSWNGGIYSIPKEKFIQ